MLISHVHFFQTLTDFEEQYLEKIHSPINADIELGELANGNVFAYSQHCHEATLALASALHKTSTGQEKF